MLRHLPLQATRIQASMLYLTTAGATGAMSYFTYQQGIYYEPDRLFVVLSLGSTVLYLVASILVLLLPSTAAWLVRWTAPIGLIGLAVAVLLIPFFVFTFVVPRYVLFIVCRTP